MLDRKRINNNNGDNASGITTFLPSGPWYFGYGPICNGKVRTRRKLNVNNVQAAILPEHRLTFAFGGIASVVPQRGFEVHGVLMQLADEEEWVKLQAFEKGTTAAQELDVFPYNDSNDIDVDGEPIDVDGEPIRCYALIMHDFDEDLLDGPIEKIPQERYLKLIAQGMREYNVDDDFVLDHIMAVPFSPTRKPQDWHKFAIEKDPVPKISYEKYLRLCGSTKTKHVFFILDKYVFRLGSQADPENPIAAWILDHAHGKADVTFETHKLVVDPDLSFCDNAQELTPQHFQWAENHFYELFEQGGFTATKVFELMGSESSSGVGGFMRRRLSLLNGHK
jgi:hypothetical protein